METPAHRASHVTRNDLLGYIRDFVDSLTETKVETRNTYERALREFVRWFDQDGRFLFAVDDVYRYRQYLVHSKGLAPASVVSYLNSVRQLCGYLHRQGIISYNPAQHIRGHALRLKNKPACLQKEEVTRLLDSVPRTDRRGPRDRTILGLMVQFGVTEVELIGANVGDFVFVDGMGALKLRGGDEMGRVVLDRTTATLIHDYLAARGKMSREQPLFLSDGNRTRGMRMTTRGIRERVNYYLEKAGVRSTGSGITPQVLKHTAAMLMADAGSSADEIRYRLRFGTLARAMKYINRASMKDEN